MSARAIGSRVIVCLPSTQIPMNNASPFLPPDSKKPGASLGWWCHLEAKVFCYVKPDRGVWFDRLFNCEMFFLKGNWHLFAYITPSQSGKMNTDSSNICRKWAKKKKKSQESFAGAFCVCCPSYINSVVYMYFYTFYMSEWPPSGRKRGETLFPKAKRLLDCRMLHLRRKSPTWLLKTFLIEPKEIFFSLDFSFCPSSHCATTRFANLCVAPVCLYISEHFEAQLRSPVFFFPIKFDFPSAGRDLAACAGFYARCETGACLHEHARVDFLKYI